MNNLFYCMYMLDGKKTISFKCPKCGEWGDIDEDQFYGRVSIHHDIDGCGYHKTIKLNESGEELTPKERMDDKWQKENNK